MQFDAGGIPLIYVYMLSGAQNTVWCKQCQFLQSWNAQKKNLNVLSQSGAYVASTNVYPADW